MRPCAAQYSSLTTVTHGSPATAASRNAVVFNPNAQRANASWLKYCCHDSGESDFPARFKGVFIPNSGHEFQWQQVYKYVIPASFMNGEYSFRIQVYDSDQNKAGGDCGYAVWTVSFSAGINGVVELIE